MHKVGDEYHVVLNEDGMPKLRVGGLPRLLANKGGARRRATTSREAALGDLADQVHPPAPAHDREGDGVDHPFQREFFDKGPEHFGR